MCKKLFKQNNKNKKKIYMDCESIKLKKTLKIIVKKLQTSSYDEKQSNCEGTKILIVTKLENWNGGKTFKKKLKHDKTQKHKLSENSKSLISAKLKKSNCEKTKIVKKKPSKTQIVTKPKKSNCEDGKKLKKSNCERKKLNISNGEKI